jgi:hypothetical protein
MMRSGAPILKLAACQARLTPPAVPHPSTGASNYGLQFAGGGG